MVHRALCIGTLRCAAALSCLGWTAAGGAQDLTNGEPIATGDYSIDLAPSVVLAGGRVMGLAGAYVAIAESTAGNAQNPAAPAVRAAHSMTHLDWDASAGVTFPAMRARNDYFNTGDPSGTNFGASEGSYLFFEAAGNLQLGRWGAGLMASAQSFNLSDEASPQATAPATLMANLGSITLQFAGGFLDGELVVGAGARRIDLVIENATTDATSGEMVTRERFNTEGVGLEAGVLYRPSEGHFRLGAAGHGPIKTEVQENSLADAPIVLPRAVFVPWRFSIGAAYQFGKVLNPRWHDPDLLLGQLEDQIDERRKEREKRRKRLHEQARQRGGDAEAAQAAIDSALDREQALDYAELQGMNERIRAARDQAHLAMQRRYVLVSAGVSVNGATERGVGLESFLQQVVNRSGENPTASVHLGVETEVIPRWLSFRSGVYREPTRFRSNRGGARYHVTVGSDVKLLEWDVFGIGPAGYRWRLRAALDYAPRYLGWALGLGGWY